MSNIEETELMAELLELRKQRAHFNERMRQVATILTVGAELLEIRLSALATAARTLTGARDMVNNLIAETGA